MQIYHTRGIKLFQCNSFYYYIKSFSIHILYVLIDAHEWHLCQRKLMEIQKIRYLDIMIIESVTVYAQ